MKFTISSTALYAKLTAASKVLAAKNSMPILECFLLDIKNGNVEITASDGEKYFITRIPLVDSDNNAKLCINAKQLMDSMKELAEQPVTLEYNPENYDVRVQHQSGEFHVIAYDAATYPVQQPLSNETTELNLKGETMLNGINDCLFATANEEVRMVMTGVFMDVQPDHVVFAGTDGRKLVRYINRDVQTGQATGVILPKKVSMILRNVLQKDDELKVRFDAERALIQTAAFEFSFRLIEGRYPNYNSVIPANNPFQATVDRATLLSALKRVSVFCNQSSGLMKLHLENNNMTLSGQDNDYVTSVQENLICEYNEMPTSIGFSCHLMIDIVSVMDCERVTIQLGDPSRPGVIVPAEQKENEELLMLLMPMMLND
ncbi:MAG: DNA polymerase III subunit beta [Bacteroidaceae bacterium]|nr:DNA polymerase III subunit beta [Prevotellaceae bacterium]MDY5631515.1 DNA polymerase III subunit beta [Bacteroidaceae bacterium]